VARIRTIKPEFFQNEALAECSPHARLLAMAILQLCDSNGVFLNIQMQVHAHAFPWEASVNVPALLGELEEIGYLELYAVKGKNYGHIPGFAKHQRLSGKEAQTDGYYPLPDQADSADEVKGKKASLPGEASGCTGIGIGTGKGERSEAGASPRFQKPTLTELIEAFRAKGVPEPEREAAKFLDHYESNGWKIGGKSKMQSWPHAVGSWCSRNFNPSSAPQQQGIQLVSI
jgi:hypothetical protein